MVAVDPDFCIGRFSRYIRTCRKCPPIAEARAFVDFLKELCDREGLNRWVVYPTSDMAVYVLSQHRDELTGPGKTHGFIIRGSFVSALLRRNGSFALCGLAPTL